MISDGGNRVSALGPIEVQSKYFKPPEAPIVVGSAADIGLFFEIRCGSCCSDIDPTPYRLRSPRERVVPPHVLQVSVTLTRETVRHGESRPDGSFWYRDVSAYVGQCRRCLRIYVATIDPP